MNKIDAAQRRADFEVMAGIERLLRGYGPAMESVLHGRRGTRNYACAFAFLSEARVPHILPDSSARNNSTVSQSRSMSIGSSILKLGWCACGWSRSALAKSVSRLSSRRSARAFYDPQCRE
jgi:hypothetical protein